MSERKDETKSVAGTYGRHVAVNCEIDAWKKRERFGDSFFANECVDDDGDIYYGSEIEGYRSGENNPEGAAVSSENLSAILSCLDSLNEKDRLVMTITIDGYRPSEIAEALGHTPDAVSIRLHRVRKSLEARLRGMLDEYGICA